LDGQKTGLVSGGETSEFEVLPGQHKLKVKMGRYGSKDFDFNLFNKETKSFTVTSMKSFTTVAAILFFIFIEFFHRILKINLSRDTFHIIIAVIILTVIGLLLFRRNRYLFRNCLNFFLTKLNPLRGSVLYVFQCLRLHRRLFIFKSFGLKFALYPERV